MIKNKTTTIRLKSQTKAEIEWLKDYPRETIEETLIQMVSVVKKIKIYFADKEPINWKELNNRIDAEITTEMKQ